MLLVMILAAGLAWAQNSTPLSQSLARISEEAEVFARVAPNMLAEETLEQKALKGQPRFRPRIGAAATAPLEPRYQTREIVSEYGYSGLRESPGMVHEFRQVISVDGRKMSTAEQARHTLALGLTSEDDRARKRMAEEFQKYGLLGAAVDFGQILLLFRKRSLDEYEFRITGSERIGADDAMVISYRQVAGPDKFLVFEGRKSIRERLAGNIWVRRSDGLPLRISMRSSWTEKRLNVRHEATVEYASTPYGVVLPASVRHIEYRGDQLQVENVFRYSPFKRFRADTEIKFQTAPESK